MHSFSNFSQTVNTRAAEQNLILHNLRQLQRSNLTTNLANPKFLVLKQLHNFLQNISIMYVHHNWYKFIKAKELEEKKKSNEKVRNFKFPKVIADGEGTKSWQTYCLTGPVSSEQILLKTFIFLFCSTINVMNNRNTNYSYSIFKSSSSRIRNCNSKKERLKSYLLQYLRLIATITIIMTLSHHN